MATSIGGKVVNVTQTARTIENQARDLGYQVIKDRACTGTVYLTVSHPALCKCNDSECEGTCNDRVIRIADHEPNTARYRYHVNRIPDLDVWVGFQVCAVRRLAEWIGRDFDEVPYLRRVATLQRKRNEQLEAATARREVETATFVEEMQQRYRTASSKDRAIADYYATLTGKARKHYGKRHRDALSRAGARWSKQAEACT